MKGKAAAEPVGEADSIHPAPVAAPAAAVAGKSAVLISTVDLDIEQVHSTLQLINKMLRKQALPAELAALLKIKEVREILELHKSNPKESSERIGQYQKDLASRLRAHDRKRPSADIHPETPSVETPVNDQPKRSKSTPPIQGILAQSELALPPDSPPPREFNVEWIQYFFQLLCSRVPYFPDRKLLHPVRDRVYVEESEDQKIYVDSLSKAQVILLLSFVHDLEVHLLAAKQKSIIIPNRFVFVPTMGDPLESGLLESWYYKDTCQCATCALRFANRQLLTFHHDYHYHKCTVMQRRKRGLDNNFRGWMESPVEWLGNRTIEFSNAIYSSLNTEEAPVHKAAHHAAKGWTERAELAEQILPFSVPVDEVKSVCFECGDELEKSWIGHPVNLAVFKDSLAIAVGSSLPLQFAWPIDTSTSGTMDVDEQPAEVVRNVGIDATNALFDHRFLNAILLHRTCFAANPKLKTKVYQMSLLTIQPNRRANALTLPDSHQVIEEEDEDMS